MMEAPDRPVASFVSMLVDAAHVHAQERKQPLATQQYAMFEWAAQSVADAIPAARSRGSTGNQGAGPWGSRPMSGTSGAGVLSADGSAVWQGECLTGASSDELCGAASSLGTTTGGTRTRSELAPSGDLEVTCQYDASFQHADASGRDGVEVRPPPVPQIGPVAFMFRWYTKRATQFPAGFPVAADLVDAPPLPPAEGTSRRGSGTGSGGGFGSTTVGGGSARASADGDSGTQSQRAGGSGGGGGGGGNGGGATATWAAASGSGGERGPRGARRAHRALVGAMSSILDAAGGSGAWKDGLPPHGGRALNRAPDPVMSLLELTEMLEEMEMVPHRVSRQDVTEVFRAVARIRCEPPNRLASAQALPDQLRYPQFCDALMRLALAADARTAMQSGAPMSEAPAAVAALLEVLGAGSPNMSAFKRKLDSLARTAKDLGKRRAAIKHLYVSAPSGMAAARAALAPIGPTGWTIDSPTRAPPELGEALMASNCCARARYLPAWTEYPLPALNLGTCCPGELRCMRVVLRNRGQCAMLLRIDTSGAADFFVATFNEMALPPGMPRVLEIEARFDEPGEYSGSLHVFSRTRGGPRHLNTVPFYALVGGHDPGAKFPACKSERGPLSIKSYAGKPSAESVAAALTYLNTPRTSVASGSVANGCGTNTRGPGGSRRPSSGVPSYYSTTASRGSRRLGHDVGGSSSCGTSPAGRSCLSSHAGTQQA
ncbi:hypothetical protein FOA52_009674 [Chlamydomonas sp. UWO 241]|nr:hypothetical protein FOA52_009674 [Chlamydomonas sp. UWO 241]